MYAWNGDCGNHVKKDIVTYKIIYTWNMWSKVLMKTTQPGLAMYAKWMKAEKRHIPYKMQC